MSTLTKTERDGLEDVFLSIHTSHDKLRHVKEILRLIISNKWNILQTKHLKRAKHGVQNEKKFSFSGFYYKKKKNLSK